MAGEASFDLAAAGIRADGAELAVGIEVLARKLEQALPHATRVTRRAKRFLSKERIVEEIEVTLGECRYALHVRGSEIDAARAQEVRGVVIRREPLGLEAWVDGIAKDLGEQGQTSAAAREALARLLD
ncbi:MAG TPA: hypothetical protein VN635_03270 [Conexibacter sp.]|nr:hypothetical protein [Conexibacter sp.]